MINTRNLDHGNVGVGFQRKERKLELRGTECLIISRKQGRIDWIKKRHSKCNEWNLEKDKKKI
jgi:hypothetical protein